MAPKEEVRPPPLGAVLNNDEIMERFGVANTGGMRRNKIARHLVLVSDPFYGLYRNRWVGDVLHYVGAGKAGDQKLISQNKTVAESPSTGEVIHLFEVFEPKKYTYIGEVGLVGQPYQETQPGMDGVSRQVWMFPLGLQKPGLRPHPTIRQDENSAKKRSRAAKTLSREERQKRARAANGAPTAHTVLSVQYSRDPNVVEYVKDEAEGKCDLCEEEAPFKTKNGEPYLECHHLRQLADGGDDAISNAVALCPNCHRKMHALSGSSDLRKLKTRIAERDAR